MLYPMILEIGIYHRSCWRQSHGFGRPPNRHQRAVLLVELIHHFGRIDSSKHSMSQVCVILLRSNLQWGLYMNRGVNI